MQVILFTVGTIAITKTYVDNSCKSQKWGNADTDNFENPITFVLCQESFFPPKECLIAGNSFDNCI